jgi:processive 1,2-diacylglycerol beta-glucosyltransferase
MTQDKLRILLLTSNTGYAHNAAANAFKEWSELLDGDSLEIKIEYLLENSHPTYNKLVNFYNFIQRNIPWVHNIYYAILEYQQELQDVRPGKPFVGKKYWVNLLKQFSPNIIISTHCQINLGYFDLAKEVLGKELVCLTYCTEIDGEFGFTRNWINPQADIFWSQTPEVSQQAIKMGMARDRVFTWGTLLNPSFYRSPLSELEKKDFLENELNLDANKFTILLGTGGAGANNHLKLLKNLLPLKNAIQVIALCGKNQTTQDQVNQWRSRHSDLTIQALPFTDKMSELLQVSSVIIARPGARTSIESIHCGCPMIFNIMGGIMPQELLAVRYFKKREIETTIRWENNLRPIIQRWLDNPEKYNQLKQRVVDEKLDDNPEQIIKSVFTEIKKLTLTN